MKKLVALLAIASFITFGSSNVAYAQEEKTADVKTTEADSAIAPDATNEAVAAEANVEEEVIEEKSFNQVLKDKFIEGGAGWMTPILLILIFIHSSS